MGAIEINSETGLNSDEVAKRISEGLVNSDSAPKPKPISEILKTNFFTLFNAINLALAVMIIFTSSLRNLMFMIIVICNSLISLFHELRARMVTERLKLISSKNTKVLRNSQISNIETDEVVIDDIIIFETGSQIVADCKVTKGVCEVDESLLTGEANLIQKAEGDSLFSGSFVVSGKIYAKVVKVGKNTYSAKISRGLDNIKSAQSEIMLAVKKIIKIISMIIIPLGIPFFINQFRINDYAYAPAILNTSAALIGMIPEGLALLTSSILAVGATRLARRKILAKDVYSVEALARINTICLDKTGTITEGSFDVAAIISSKKLESDLDSLLRKNSSKNKEFLNLSDAPLMEALKIIISCFEDGNETLKSIKRIIPVKKKSIEPISVVPFNSQRKFSSVSLTNNESFLIGSAEKIFKNNPKICELVSKFSDYRVLSIAKSKEEVKKDCIPNDAKLLGVVLLTDKIRKGAIETIKYFKENDVDIKIISGDNTDTVSKIAKAVGIPNYDKIIDSGDLKKFSDVLTACNKYTIFGRTTPEKKCEIIKALKIKGRRVAMTGDGVNDILALKESDCSVAMASGSTAAREISHLILIDSDFSAIPGAVAEGRRAINNIQTMSSLFLVKTIYSAILVTLLLFFSISYPFMPIQMSLISALTVGIPSFLLAFEANTSRVEKSLFSNIIKVSLPSAIAISVNIILCFLAHKWFNIPKNIYSSIAVLTTASLSIQLLRVVSLPFNNFRKTIFWFVIIAFSICFVFFGNIFLLSSPISWNIKYIFIALILGLVSSFLYEKIN